MKVTARTGSGTVEEGMKWQKNDLPTTELSLKHVHKSFDFEDERNGHLVIESTVNRLNITVNFQLMIDINILQGN